MAIGAIISAVAGIGGSLLAGKAQSDAAGDAAGLSGLAIAEQRRQFDLTRADFAPWREAGVGALNILSSMFLGTPQTETITETTPGTADQSQLFGLREEYAAMPEITQLESGTTFNNERYALGQKIAQLEAAGPTTTTRTVPVEGTGGAPDYSEFYKSPGYQFRMDEGIQALDRSAAAGGRLRGGGHERELIRYSQGVASGEFNNYANRLSSMAGMGQSATQSTAAAGANSANQIGAAYANQGNALMAGGTARASGYAGAANNLIGAANNYDVYDYLNKPGGSATFTDRIQ